MAVGLCYFFYCFIFRFKLLLNQLKTSFNNGAGKKFGHINLYLEGYLIHLSCHNKQTVQLLIHKQSGRQFSVSMQRLKELEHFKVIPQHFCYQLTYLYQFGLRSGRYFCTVQPPVQSSTADNEHQNVAFWVEFLLNSGPIF